MSSKDSDLSSLFQYAHLQDHVMWAVTIETPAQYRRDVDVKTGHTVVLFSLTIVV